MKALPEEMPRCPTGSRSKLLCHGRVIVLHGYGPSNFSGRGWWWLKHNFNCSQLWQAMNRRDTCLSRNTSIPSDLQHSTDVSTCLYLSFVLKIISQLLRTVSHYPLLDHTGTHRRNASRKLVPQFNSWRWCASIGYCHKKTSSLTPKSSCMHVLLEYTEGIHPHAQVRGINHRFEIRSI